MSSSTHDYLEVTPARARAHPSGRATPRVGGLYDRFVALMRMTLPAVALAIAVMLLAWPALNPSEFSFLLAIDKVRLSPDRLRMEKPRYYGTDSENRPFIIEADSAVQTGGDNERVALTAIQAQLELDGGVDVAARAAEGVYYPDDKQLKLEGDVSIKTSNGYVIMARDAVIDIEERRVFSMEPVRGTGPMGDFSAGGFEAEVDQDKLRFNKMVQGRLFPRKKTTLPQPTPNEGGTP